MKVEGGLALQNQVHVQRGPWLAPDRCRESTNESMLKPAANSLDQIVQLFAYEAHYAVFGFVYRRDAHP
jgi:hypothetical protein